MKTVYFLKLNKKLNRGHILKKITDLNGRILISGRDFIIFEAERWVEKTLKKYPFIKILGEVRLDNIQIKKQTKKED